jgi:hypothetical protein
MQFVVAAVIEDDDIQKPEDYRITEVMPNVKDHTFKCQSLDQVRAAPAMHFAINSFLDMIDVLPGLLALNGSSVHVAQRIVADMKTNERWQRVISMIRESVTPLKALKSQQMVAVTGLAEDYVLKEIFYRIPKGYDFTSVHDSLFDCTSGEELPLGLEVFDRFRHYTPASICRYMTEARDRLVVTMSSITTN